MGDNHGSDLPQTSIDLLIQIREGGDAARLAGDRFYKCYSPHVRRYFLQKLRNSDSSEEATQDFFATIVPRVIARYAREKGSFRHYLLTAMKNYVVSFLERYSERKFMRLDDCENPDAVLPSVDSDPDQEFHDSWVRDLVNGALEALKEYCLQRKLKQHYELFVAFYLDQRQGDRQWKKLGGAMGLDETTARNRFEVARDAFCRIVFDLVVKETGSEDAARKELEFLYRTVKWPKIARQSAGTANDPGRGQVVSLLELAACAPQNSARRASGAHDPTLSHARIVEAFGKARAEHILRALADPDASLESLRSIKEMCKREYHGTAAGARKHVAGGLYYAAIAAAFVLHGKNISSVPFAKRLSVFERLANQTDHGPLKAVFDRAIACTIKYDGARGNAGSHS